MSFVGGCVLGWGGGGYLMLSRVSVPEAFTMKLAVTVRKLPSKLIPEQPDF